MVIKVHPLQFLQGNFYTVVWSHKLQPQIENLC